ncbi:MAG TPA: AraC family transcriptional regulator [Abditibacteriaceae bacterium]|nr:AraC family transcriptional regulator [Abditibacteriaceae bacterium]
MSTSRASNLLDEIYLRLFVVKFITLSPKTWNAQNVRDAFWRFYVNDRDGAILKLDHGDLALRAGALYLVPEDVHFSCDNTGDVGHFYLHFDVLGVARPILQQLFCAPLEIEKTSALAREAGAFRDDVKARRESEIVVQCRAKALLFNCLAHIFARDDARNVAQYPRLSSHHEPILPALEWIESHLQEKIENRMLARLCHWSADHFARRFRECVGQSPGRYVLSRRIAVASQQLLFTQKSIEEIARESGFANRFHFSRAFTREKQCAPAAYRNTTQV